MKKFVICLIAFVFVTAIATVSFGRTMQEEAQAVRNYLDTVDAKLVKAKKANQSAKINLLHAQKNAALARWNKLQKSMEVAPAAPAPVTPPPIIVTVPPTPEVIRSGRGIAAYVDAGLIAGLTGYSANVGFDLGEQPDTGLKIRVGADYISGNNPSNNDPMKAVNAKIGAVYYLTPYLPSIGLPITWYVGADGLYPAKVDRGRTGQWGVQAYGGADYDIPQLGIVNFELGYAAVKYSVDQPALKGIILKIGYGIIF
jgi:hypothetical protein